MPEKISIMKESGELLNSNIVSIFMIPDTQKKYIITTENAVDPHGLTVLHVSELINNDEDLTKIATDEEWSSIKTIMRAIISGNVGSYQYLPLIEKSRGKGQYSRDISVSASACKQMVDNYADALKSLKDVKNDTPAVEVENSSADGIFPTDNVETNEVNEVSPGIADLTKEDSVNVIDSNVPQSVPIVATNDTTAAPSILQGVPDDASVAPVALSAVPETPQAVVQEPVSDVPVQTPVVVENSQVIQEPAPVVEVPTPVVQEPTPVTESAAPVAQEPAPVVESVSPAAPASVPVETQVPVVENSVITSEPVKTDDTVVDNQVNIDSDAIDAITNSILSKLKGVQQVEPPVEKVKVESNINFNSEPSFAPDATLDQVVVGAQNLFMNGVQSLVQTITEKVYRDLYKKEKELNDREELLNQREKMLNEQISMMVNNFNNNQPVQNVTVDTISSPVES